MKRALFDILRAVGKQLDLAEISSPAILEPGMGYCQGMNFIAGVLLIETLCPTTAFWTLLAMIRLKSFSGLFCPGVPALKLKLVQFQHLVSEFFPPGHSALLKLSIPADLIAHQFFVTAFAYFMHPSLLIRFWDIFFVNGWQSFMTLGLATFSLLEPHLRVATDTESALQILQKFRTDTCQLSFATAEGQEFFENLMNAYEFFRSKVTRKVLTKYATAHFLSILRNSIHRIDIFEAGGMTKAPQIQTVADEPLPSQKTAAEAQNIPEPTGNATSGRVVPPFLLLPKFQMPDRQIADGDLQAIIIHYVTARSASNFQVEPGTAGQKRMTASDSGKESGQTDESPVVKKIPLVEQPAKLLSWCLLATQTAESSSCGGSVIRGRGSLPLKGFYVIIDTRMFSGDIETSWQPHATPTDALTQYLFPQSAMKPEKINEICNAARWSCPRALEQILDTLDQSLNVGNRLVVKETDETEEFERKCKSSSSELLTWIRAHNTRLAEGMEQRRSIGRGGFLIAPLKALIHTKLKFEARASQLAQDTQIFAEKILNVGKQVTAKLKELERLKSKAYLTAMFVDRLGSEKKQLMLELHRAVTSPKDLVVIRRDSEYSSCSSSVPDSAKTSSIWSRMVTNIFGRNNSSKETLLQASPMNKSASSPDFSEYSRSPSGVNTASPEVVSRPSEITPPPDHEDDTSLSSSEASVAVKGRSVMKNEDISLIEDIANTPDRLQNPTRKSKCVKFALDDEVPRECSSPSIPSSAAGSSILSPGSSSSSSVSPSTIPTKFASRLHFDAGQQKNITKLDRRLKTVERYYAHHKQRQSSLLQRQLVLEDAIRDASDIKSMLLNSYHELAIKKVGLVVGWALICPQQEDEDKLVGDMLRKCCDWTVESLPYAILRIAGVVHPSEMSYMLSDVVPDLYLELLSLPPFRPQFDLLFGRGS